jgi:hypothetical protein
MRRRCRCQSLALEDELALHPDESIAKVSVAASCRQHQSPEWRGSVMSDGAVASGGKGLALWQASFLGLPSRNPGSASPENSSHLSKLLRTRAKSGSRHRGANIDRGILIGNDPITAVALDEPHAKRFDFEFWRVQSVAWSPRMRSQLRVRSISTTTWLSGVPSAADSRTIFSRLIFRSPRSTSPT